MDLDERGNREELGKVEGGNTVMRIYYVREKSIFNKKKICQFQKECPQPLFLSKRKNKNRET